jgi:hypothetical protein
MAYSVKKAGITFKTKVNVNPDLTGKSANFSLTYYNDADPNTAISVPGSFVEAASIPGLYFSPDITVASAGDYTFNITNSVDKLGNVSASVVVVNASLSDIKNAVDFAQSDITAIREKTDALNTAELEAISQQLVEVQSSVNSVNNLIVNKTTNLTFTGVNETSNLVAGDEVVGNDSDAVGTVVSSVFDTDTIVNIKNVVGTFTANERVTGSGTTSRISIVVNGNAAVDSVMEFVSEINSALENGASGLSAIAEFTDNLEFMLEGRSYTDTYGNTIAETDSKGLAEIFAEIVANGENTDAAKIAINEVKSSVTLLHNSVSNGFTAIEASVAFFKASIENKVETVREFVSVNSAILGNINFGNEAIKNLLDSLAANLITVDNDVDSIINILNDTTFGLSAIKTLLGSMDSKLDTIENKIDILTSSSSAKIFI